MKQYGILLRHMIMQEIKAMDWKVLGFRRQRLRQRKNIMNCAKALTGLFFLLAMNVRADSVIINPYRDLSFYRDCGVVEVVYRGMRYQAVDFYTFSTLYDDGGVRFSWKKLDSRQDRCVAFDGGLSILGGEAGADVFEQGAGKEKFDSVVDPLSIFAGVTKGVSAYVPLFFFRDKGFEYDYSEMIQASLGGRRFLGHAYDIEYLKGPKRFIFESKSGLIRKITLERVLESGTQVKIDVNYLEIDYHK